MIRVQHLDTVHIDGDLRSLAVQPGGGFFAAGFGDGLVQLWTIAPLQPQWCYTNVAPPAEFGDTYAAVTGLAFSPDGTTLASAGEVIPIRLWNVPTQREVRRLQSRAVDIEEPFGMSWEQYTYFAPCTIAFSPSGKYFVCGQANGDIDVWEVATWRGAWHLRAHNHFILSLAVSHDDTTLISGSYDNTVGFWNLRNGTGTLYTSPQTTDVRVVAPVFNTPLIVSGGHGEARTAEYTTASATIHLWNTTSKTIEHTFATQTSWVEAVAIHPNGRLMAVGHSDYTIGLWDLKTRTELTTLTSASEYVHHVCFSADGTLLLSGGWRYTDGGSAIDVWSVNMR